MPIHTFTDLEKAKEAVQKMANAPQHFPEPVYHVIKANTLSSCKELEDKHLMICGHTAATTLGITEFLFTKHFKS